MNWDITGLSYYCMLARHAVDALTTSSATCAPATASRSCSRRRPTRSPRQRRLARRTRSTTGDLRRLPGDAGRAGAASSAACRTPSANAGGIGVFYWEPTWYADPRQRLGPGQHQRHRRRVGQHGGLQLAGPGQPERAVVRVNRRVAWPAVAALVIAGTVLAPTMAHAGTGAVANGGFEDAVGQEPPSWTETGQVDASFVEAGGQSGANRLSHWAATDYRVTTSQTVTGLSRGTYTLTAAVRSSGGQRAAELAVIGCGPVSRVELPRTGPEWWVRLALSVRVSRGSCTVAVHSDAYAGNWVNVDDVAFIRSDGRAGAPLDIPGADVSQLTKNEDHGAVYRDAAGRQRRRAAHPVAARRQLRAAQGVGRPGRRVQHEGRRAARGEPGQGRRHEAAHRLPLLRRVGRPGQAEQAGRVGGLPFDAVAAGRLRPHLRRADALRAQGTPADMVQIGNEINGGMLWPDGSTGTTGTTSPRCSPPAPGGKAVYADDQGRAAPGRGRQQRRPPLVVRQRRRARRAVRRHRAVVLPYWHGPLACLQANLNDLAARYGKDVLVAETAYGFTTAEDDHETEHLQRRARSRRRLPGHPAGPGRGAAGRVQRGAPCRTGTAWASSTGSRPGRPSPAPAGTRPTRPRATAGRTRRCSTTTTGPCRPSTCSAGSEPRTGPPPPDMFPVGAASAGPGQPEAAVVRVRPPSRWAMTSAAM